MMVYRLFLILVVSCGQLFVHSCIEDIDFIALRDGVKAAFQHAFVSYLNHAFPADEIMPISCQPRVLQDRGTLDDVLGDYMLTLIDSLDALIILREHEMFKQAIDLMIEHQLNFDKDINVSVFEANIRVLGGLLSAHQLAVHFYNDDVYDGHCLLDYAIDLADRLLPAFQTRTGIPVHRVNLKYGMIPDETIETCTAAGTSFLLEFSLLSRLTGDQKYERTAFKAMKSVWYRRSSLNLVGSLIDTDTGKWIHDHSGIGAGIDSFYEVLFKSSILTGDENLLQWFNLANNAALHHTTINGSLNIEVNMHYGRRQLYSTIISSLQAFWPGLQSLAGNVEVAINSFDALQKIWHKYEALPDMYSLSSKGLFEVYGRDYPLRPEMIESAYCLYMATREPKYLEFGVKFFNALERKCKVACGYASIADLETGRLDDRMDSYFLAETLKYLYLLFDEAIPNHQARKSIFCRHGSIDLRVHDYGINSPEPFYPVADNITASTSSSIEPNFGYNSDILEGSFDHSDVQGAIPSDRFVAVETEVSDRLGDGDRLRKSLNLNPSVEQSSSIQLKSHCVSEQSTLFSTEGHLFILNPSLRSSDVTFKYPKNRDKRADDTITLDICVLPQD